MRDHVQLKSEEVVFERSQGNAFLVEEIVAAVDGGADPGDLPPSLRDVLLARTETVSDPAQQILRTRDNIPSVLANDVERQPTPTTCLAHRAKVRRLFRAVAEHQRPCRSLRQRSARNELFEIDRIQNH